MGDELKPCPFGCPDQPKIWKVKRWFEVGCAKCKCAGPLGETEAEAIESWNTRTETQSQATGRFITLWRKPAPDNLDWDFHISENTDELQQVLANLKEREGIWQITTYRLGEKIESLADVIAKAGEP